MTKEESSPSFMSNHRHSLATAALCLASLTNAYSMVSVSPYAAYMVMFLLPNRTTPQNVGTYSGWLIGSFYIGRFITAYGWGRLADIYGRIFTVQCMLLLSAIFMFLFGTSTNFFIAIVWRFLLGTSGGAISILKTLASEISPQRQQTEQKPPSSEEQKEEEGTLSTATTKLEDDEHQTANDDTENVNISQTERLERRAMGLVLGTRVFAVLMSPAAAGFLAEPLQQYFNVPSTYANPEQGDEQGLEDVDVEGNSSNTLPSWLAPGSWLYSLLDSFPFILPNVFGTILCLLSVLSIFAVVDETLAPDKRRDPRYMLQDAKDAVVQYVERKWKQRQQQQEIRHPQDQELTQNEATSLLTSSKDPIQQQSSSLPVLESETEEGSLWDRPLTRLHLWAIWAYTFVKTFIDESLPLFYISTLGGLALQESQIGSIMSGAGVVFAVAQYSVYSYLTNTLGLHKAAAMSSIAGTIPPLLIPISLLLPRGGATMLIFLSLVVGFTNIMHFVFFASMAVAINKTVDASQRVTVNAMVMFGNSVGKGLGPVVAGMMVVFSFSGILLPVHYGSLLIWSPAPVMGAIMAYVVIDLGRKASHLMNNDGRTTHDISSSDE